MLAFLLKYKTQIKYCTISLCIIVPVIFGNIYYNKYKDLKYTIERAIDSPLSQNLEDVSEHLGNIQEDLTNAKELNNSLQVQVDELKGVSSNISHITEQALVDFNTLTNNNDRIRVLLEASIEIIETLEKEETSL